MADHRNGHAPFPPTMVVSSERSGLNLVRHACEAMSSCRTPGKPHLVQEGPLLFHRTHYAGHAGAPVGPFAPLFSPDGQSNYRQAMLLLRDPAETFVRAYDRDFNLMRRYCENIQLFDRFRGQKLLILYDDLVTTESAFHSIFAFFGIAASFEPSKLAQVRLDAVAWYDQNQKTGSQTRGDARLLKTHQTALSPHDLGVLRRFLKQELGELADAYLTRWAAQQP